VSANTLGRYQIIREIARSNDIVYEAMDTGINRRVALKELLVPPNLAGAQRRERVERFYREARAAGTLAHPNIVTIYEAGEDHGRHFIAMEFLEGQTLREVLDMEVKLPIERALDIAKQICAGLSYAHSRGVIHRDVKPDNIQILPSGLIKITDFGIARIMEEPTLTADGQVFGTPSYMSPEQVAGKPLDHRTDIFSLGIVLYEMLTGRKPFTGDTVVTITYNIMNQDVTIPPAIPPYIERVLAHSLAKDPNLRYSSAEEFSGNLDPSSYNPYQAMQQPDPFGATINSPGPLYNGSVMQPHPQDPFANVQPGNIPLPRVPSKPLLSAETKYFLKVMLSVLVLCGMLIAFIWLLAKGYEGYQRQAKTQEVGVHLDAGRDHFNQQSYQAAIEEYQAALKLTRDPEVAKVARRNIATSYISLGVASERVGNYSQAATCYQQALVYDSAFADAHLFLGNVLFKQRRDNEALAAWGKAIDLGGGGKAATNARQNCAVLYNLRGDEAYNRGDSGTAIGWWRKAVDLAPGTQPGFAAQDKLDKFGG
jgi:serine/threonine protein kinase